jgi:hypothetical protein
VKILTTKGEKSEGTDSEGRKRAQEAIRLQTEMRLIKVTKVRGAC